MLAITYKPMKINENKGSQMGHTIKKKKRLKPLTVSLLLGVLELQLPPRGHKQQQSPGIRLPTIN